MAVDGGGEAFEALARGEVGEGGVEPGVGGARAWEQLDADQALVGCEQAQGEVAAAEVGRVEAQVAGAADAGGCRARRLGGGGEGLLEGAEGVGVEVGELGLPLGDPAGDLGALLAAAEPLGQRLVEVAEERAGVGEGGVERLEAPVAVEGAQQQHLAAEQSRPGEQVGQGGGGDAPLLAPVARQRRAVGPHRGGQQALGEVLAVERRVGLGDRAEERVGQGGKRGGAGEEDQCGCGGQAGHGVVECRPRAAGVNFWLFVRYAAGFGRFGDR